MQSKTERDKMLAIAKRDQLARLRQGVYDLDYAVAALGQLYWIIEQEVSYRQLKADDPEKAGQLVKPGQMPQAFYTVYASFPGVFVPVVPLVQHRDWLTGQLQMIDEYAGATPAEREAAACHVLDKVVEASREVALMVREFIRWEQRSNGIRAEAALIAKPDLAGYRWYELGQPLPCVDHICPVCGLIVRRSASATVRTCEALCFSPECLPLGDLSSVGSPGPATR